MPSFPLTYRPRGQPSERRSPGIGRLARVGRVEHELPRDAVKREVADERVTILATGLDAPALECDRRVQIRFEVVLALDRVVPPVEVGGQARGIDRHFNVRLGWIGLVDVELHVGLTEMAMHKA